MNPLAYAWLIPLLPALGFLVNITLGYRLGRRGAAYLSVGLLAVSTALAVALLVQVGAAGRAYAADIPWIAVRGEAGIPLGIFLDPAAALLVFMVAFVSLFIHVFSISYMAGEARYPTFFAYLSLFSAAMLGLVLGKNLFVFLFFWELMGVMSYLLIGFFYKKVAAQQAMKKAFLVTKLTDLALLVAIFWIYRAFGTLDLPSLAALAPALPAATLTGIGLLLFAGAMGKSAQFPFHVWLLDAMEGPTPVSAMIHAATMVAAGVLLVARTYPVLELGGVLPVVAWVGGITALFAAALAPAFADIKKILAWSTVSQLGFMFLGLGALGWVAALFHLLAHAFFKALLFLCAGAMIHGSGTQDVFEMNALARRMPSTRWTFVIGGLSLAGVVPFAGFWSKDEILLAVTHAAGARAGYWPLVFLAYAASLLTAFYICRAYLLAFEAPARPSPEKAAAWNTGPLPALHMGPQDVLHDQKLEASHLHDPPHGAPAPMRAALWVLAAGAVLVGLAGSPVFGNALQRLLGGEPEPLAAQLPVFALGTLVALAGIGLAWLLYGSGRRALAAPVALTRLLQRRFYLDDAYYAFLAAPLTRLASPLAWFDRRLLDGLIDAGAQGLAVLAEALRRVQTGRLEHYAWTVAAGALLLVFALGLGGRP